ncbi:MAG: hypothetical protein NT136_02100 [Candidatus Moranbacteria bacterium]|nr:hypothetical protein [Candidatus Moranbacteria bacterium]
MIRVKGDVKAVLGTCTRKVLGYNPSTEELLLQKLNAKGGEEKEDEGFVLSIDRVTYVDVTKLPS